MSAPVVVSDMDGTLAAYPWRAVLGWIREHHPSPAARRFVVVRLPRVVLAATRRGDREAFRVGWMADQARLLRDLPEARLTEMAEWVVEHHLWPGRRQVAIDAVMAAAAVARATYPGSRLLLATGAYRQLGEAFGRRIGADVALGTPLEVREGVATGALSGPTQNSEAKAAAVAEDAAGSEVLAAFGDSYADIPLLRLAVRAVAVAPDAGLRREAQLRGWEILEG